MAQKINLFELNVDVDSVLESQSQLKNILDLNKKALDRLKDSGDTTSRAFVEQEAKVKNLNREYNASQTQLGKLIQLQGKEITTVKQAEAALTIINKQWAEQRNLYGDNSEQAEKLALKHKELKDRTVELRKGIGDTSTGIGRYSEGMQEALGKSTLFGQAQSFIISTLNVAKPIYSAIKTELSAMKVQYLANAQAANAMAGGQKAVAVATNIGSAALKLFKIALISTGIGAIVVLLGSLVAWFANTQKGVDFVNKALAVLGAAFDVIVDRFSKFGGIVFGLISGQKSLTEAWGEGKEALSGIGDEMQREIDLAGKLADKLKELERGEKILSATRSAANTRIKELNRVLEDRTKSDQERLKAAEEIGNIEADLAARELKLANESLTAKQGKLKVDAESLELLDKLVKGTADYEEVRSKLGFSETKDPEVDAFLEAFKKREEAQQRTLEVQTTTTNKNNTLLEEIARKREAETKKAIELSKQQIDEEIKASKTRLAIFIQENETKSEGLQEEIAVIENVRDEKLRILTEELKAGKKTTEEAELEKLQIKEAFLNDQKELVVEYANEELQIYIDANQTRLQNEQLLTQSLIDEEQARLDAIAQKQREFQETRLAQGEINEREYNALINEINTQNDIEKAALRAELVEQEKAAAVIDLENRREAAKGLFLQEMEIRREQLEMQKQSELETAEKTGADKALIVEKYNAIERDINQVTMEFKLDVAQQTFGNLASILGKESAAGKAAAIAQTTIDTYRAATAAYAAMAGIPVVGPALGAIASGAAVVSGLSSVRKILSTKKPDIPQAEKGMLVGGKLEGPRHSQGGIPIEAEGGEFIMNRRSTQLFYPLIEMMNRIGNGGVSSSTNGFFRDGGMVERSITGFGGSVNNVSVNARDIDYNRLIQGIADANSNLPRPVTDVKDIIGSVNNYKSIVDGATI